MREMKLRFFSSASANLCRMPDGRPSSTSRSTRLYAATRSCGASDFADAFDGTALRPPHGCFNRGQSGRCDRERAQPAPHKLRHVANVACEIAAQAHLTLNAAPMLSHLPHDAPESGPR